jgi:hypothetical protein
VADDNDSTTRGSDFEGGTDDGLTDVNENGGKKSSKKGHFKFRVKAKIIEFCSMIKFRILFSEMN